ncbi:MAG TPA: hypothetical protein VGK29_17500 [Paludibaculum sp.]|jgi:hypothetical protein
MTLVEARYEFTAPFSDSWLAAVEELHGVYGMQAVKLTPKMDGLTILYDATRLKLTDVENRLQRCGLPVRFVAN